MPLLDVSEAFDPLFWDVITVIRRIITVTQNGRATTSQSMFSMQAVVTMASPDDLVRVPDYQMMHKVISIYSIERLQGPSTNPSFVPPAPPSGPPPLTPPFLPQQFPPAAQPTADTMPDLVSWHGSLYVVKALDDYSGYGRGFVHAVCESLDAVDPPPMPETVGNA